MLSLRENRGDSQGREGLMLARGAGPDTVPLLHEGDRSE